MTRRPGARATIAPAALLGAVLGVLILHPVADAISWFDLPPDASARAAGPWRFMTRRIVSAFAPAMLPMTGLFALAGAAVGVVVGAYARRLALQPGASDIDAELARGLDALIAGGESERLEFKASARWDGKLGRINHALEDGVARAIGGFLNHRGGTLLVGVTDGGDVIGVAPDYQTLKRPDRDGFEQFVLGLVRTRLGGDVCPLVHVGFTEVGGRDVCRIVVEPAERPVYCVEDSVPRFFLRVGNGTRELNVRDAVQYIGRGRRRARPTR